MRNFKNNFRKHRYKSHSERNHQKNNNGSKLINDLQNGSNFVRKSPGRNNHNAPKLIEKYSNLAREALSNGDKILSENYLQHADHFSRILSLQELNKNQSESNNVIEQDFKSDIKTLSSEKEKDNNNLNTSNKVD